ncbi:MAG: hypothetical protein IT359_17150 [Gemmatimonadaceae bacterium]|nr:hypothetical protein [Gemmatimonadaceae bacterium]
MFTIEHDVLSPRGGARQLLVVGEHAEGSDRPSGSDHARLFAYGATTNGSQLSLGRWALAEVVGVR